MFSRSLLVKPSSSMTPSWSVVVMWLLVGFVSGGPLTSLDVNNGTSFDPHDGNSNEGNGNYTESPENPGPTSFDPHDGNSTERNGNYTDPSSKWLRRIAKMKVTKPKSGLFWVHQALVGQHALFIQNRRQGTCVQERRRWILMGMAKNNNIIMILSNIILLYSLIRTS
ncbi:unnamed protein product [Boreogadus saida]